MKGEFHGGRKGLHEGKESRRIGGVSTIVMKGPTVEESAIKVDGKKKRLLLQGKVGWLTSSSSTEIEGDGG